ncbi:MAG: hypothetical protein GQ468_05390 [Candidatus Scalindua sp.]|nr:hypothetical protein [Candidatus Scalindua sp.]
MTKLMVAISLFLVAGLYNQLEASSHQTGWVLPQQKEVPCVGGAGNGIYSVPPVCHEPFCDTGPNPANGCLLSSILVPPGTKPPPVTPPPVTYPFDVTKAAWNDKPQVPETGMAELQYDIIPLSDAATGVTGLSVGPATDFDNLAVNIQLSKTGEFKAVRSDGTALYEAENVIRFKKDERYHVRMVIDIDKHIYSAWITPPGGTEILLADNYFFRQEQIGAVGLDNFSSYATVDSFGIDKIALIDSDPAIPPPAQQIRQIVEPEYTCVLACSVNPQPHDIKGFISQ